MVKGMFICGRYEKGGVEFWVRSEHGEKIKLFAPYRPYFYYRSDTGQYVGLRNNGERVLCAKVEAESPKEIPILREKYEETFEADVPFVRRWLIDKGITSGLDFFANPTGNVVLVSPSSVNLPLRVAYVDIEVYTKARFPNPNRKSDKVVAVTIWKNGIYRTFLLCPETREHIEDFQDRESEIKVFDREDNLLAWVNRELWDVDVVATWGEFDMKFLVSRFEHYLPVQWLDLSAFFRKFYRLPSYALKDVATQLGIIDNPIPKWCKEWWERGELDTIAKYNKQDVEILVKLDRLGWRDNPPLKLTEFAWELKSLVGMENLNQCQFWSSIIDTIMLRKYHGKYVLPTKVEHEPEEYTGALVLPTPTGKFENVAFFDLSRYYPSIILALNLSPEGEGILPSIIREFIQIRDRIKEDMKIASDVERERLKVKDAVVKSLLNAFYGYFAYPGSRMYNPKIASKITEMGRKGISFLVSQSPYPVLYGHTDSLGIQIPFEKCEEFENYLNQKLKEFCRKEGIEEVLSIKWNEYYSTILFEGVKMRFLGHLIWENGRKVDYYKMTGYVRRDDPPLTKRLIRYVGEMILKDVPKKEIVNFIRQTIQNFRKYPLEEIAIPKRLDKELNEYKAKTDYIRGAIYARDKLGQDIRKGDRVFLLYVRNMDTDVIAPTDLSDLKVEIDEEKMIERVLKLPLQDILRAGGITWEEVEGQRRLDELW